MKIGLRKTRAKVLCLARERSWPIFDLSEHPSNLSNVKAEVGRRGDPENKAVQPVQLVQPLAHAHTRVRAPLVRTFLGY